MPDFDLILRGGMICDGGGDVALHGDRIAAVGSVDGSATRIIDVDGLAVAPDFINMLSWAVESLIVDR